MLEAVTGEPIVTSQRCIMPLSSPGETASEEEEKEETGQFGGKSGGREEVGGGSQPHRAENQPPCGTGQTDRHARRSAVLTIICGGRAVGAGCKSSHDNDDDDDDNSDNNDNNQREVSVKLCKEPHINQVKQVGVPWWPGGPWSQDGKKQAAWTGYWDAADH